MPLRSSYARLLSSRFRPTGQQRWSSSFSFSAPTTVLFLAGLFPEPTASAAGVRTMTLIERLAKTEGISSVHFASGATKPKTNDANSLSSLEALGITFHRVPPNDSEAMQTLLSQCVGDNQCQKGENLMVVLDRFYNEEAYSFHIHQHCPKATIVLDLQDLHSLRRRRQRIIESRTNLEEDPLSNLPLGGWPDAGDTDLQRELASIHRSDLTLVCSPVELEKLHSLYQIPKDKLCEATFFVDPPTTTPPPFKSRQDFVFVGGFRHAPNVDAVWQLKELWPVIRQQLPRANLNVYGPFCPRDLKADPSNGFFLKGWTPKPIQELLSQSCVLLAPLRFGAGIKGKIVDAWAGGTPVVTTPIGSEGMLQGEGEQEWGGVVANTSHEFIEGAMALYQDQSQWTKAQQSGHGLLQELYGVQNWQDVIAKLIEVHETKETRRQSDYTRAVLWHQSVRSTKYFSKWIEIRKEASKR